jgi:hypothetical protein
VLSKAQLDVALQITPHEILSAQTTPRNILRSILPSLESSENAKSHLMGRMP